MAKKTVGYVELEWTCPTCGTKNPGLKKSCTSCGAPQPQNTQFELGGEREIIADAQKATAAAKGADIHCPYCNTRNAADAQTCLQCGGDLKEGLKRESGRVLSGAPVSSAPLVCPACGTANPASSRSCKACGVQLGGAAPAATAPVTPATSGSTIRPWMAMPVIAILLTLCCIAGYFIFRTTTLMGQVQETSWQRVVAIEAQRQATHEDWRDRVPSDAEVLGCQQKYRSRQDNPAPGAKEVCATELVDQGNGAAKVVESCYYEVYDDFCKYQALEWQAVDEPESNGNDLQPFWPQVNLAQGEREGARSENYTVTFDTKDGIKQFTTSDASLYSQLQPGTEWTLVVNTLGVIVDVSSP